MKFVLNFILCSLFSSIGAQNLSLDTSKKELFISVELIHIEEFPYGNDSLDSVQRSNQIYEYGTKNLEFPGGQAKLYEFLRENIQYPKECIEKGIEGKVYVKFVVMKDGSISNITILKPAHKLLNEEAIRVVGLMPKWNPGQINDDVVNSFYTLPITFLVDDGPVKKKKKKKLYKVKSHPIL